MLFVSYEILNEPKLSIRLFHLSVQRCCVLKQSVLGHSDSQRALSRYSCSFVPFLYLFRSQRAVSNDPSDRNANKRWMSHVTWSVRLKETQTKRKIANHKQSNYRTRNSIQIFESLLLFCFYHRDESVFEGDGEIELRMHVRLCEFLKRS